jgi:hypothetical protein
MAVVTNPLLIIPAVAGLLALTQTTGDCAFNANRQFSADRGAIQTPQTSEASKSPDGMPVMLRANSQFEDETRNAVPLTCLQMQVIDEVELISEPAPDADCN